MQTCISTVFKVLQFLLLFFKVVIFKCPSLSFQKSVTFPSLTLYYYIILQCCSLPHCVNFSLFCSFESLRLTETEFPVSYCSKSANALNFAERNVSLIILQSFESFHKPLNVSITTGNTLHQLGAISCNVSFRSVFPSQPSKPSLNLMLSVDTKLLIW